MAVLIDEYDKPLIDHILQVDHAKQYRDILRNFYSVLKAEDAYLRFVLLTGVSKFSKISVFSGLNNLDDITLSEEYAALLGYTQQEVETTFKDRITTLAAKLNQNGEETLRQIGWWYNGYRFSPAPIKVYNPFSILLLFKDNAFRSYWFETGTPTFLIELIKNSQFDLQHIDSIEVTEAAFSSYELEKLSIVPLLYQTGYVTIQNYNTSTRLSTLGYPNYEVRNAFLEALLEGFSETEQGLTGGYIWKLRKCLEDQNWESFFGTLKIFFANIPYDIQLSNEKYYQTIFYLIASMLKLYVHAEVRTNKGRIDMVIELERHVYFFEFKLTGTKEEALSQIQDKKHYEKYQGQDKTITLLGVVFSSAEQNISDIGMSCRFPGATNYLSYWDNLLKGKNHIIPIPENRWDRNAYQSTDRRDKNKMMGQYGGLIDDPEYFDHQLFGLSPEEARQTDPQHRLLLEQTWHALEDTGISFQSFSERKTAVFVGIMASDYLQLSSSYNQDINQYASIGNYSSIAANRISHTFKFRGISKTIDTACSSSLVAIHDAVCALRNKTCDYVVVGGANLILHPWKSISFSKARMLSEDGRCKTFDTMANGYVAGEGAAVIVLERAQDAIKEHHSIHGIIKSAAVNHVDQSAHISAPSVKAQSSLIQEAIREAGIDKDTISYVEAHGTGTSLGDPIEVEALSRVFNQKSRRSPLYIGSVKTNIGHLEAAAGLAGVIKVLLMMKYKWMPQSLNVTEQNPLLNVGRHIQVVREKKQWISDSNLCRAGVSSFGFGGSNAHIILQQKNDTVQAPSKNRPSYYPILLSAASKTSLDNLRAQVLDQYQSNPRSSWRIARQCSNKPSLLKRLGGYIDDDQHLAFMTPNTIGQSNNRLFFSKVMAGICRADIETQCAYLIPYIQHYASQLSDKVKENQILDTCIVMLAMADFLVDQGYRVNEVCAEGTGCLAALVWVDILSFQDLLVYLADDTHELKFKRPSKTILLYNRKIRPYPFQAEDIKHLLHHAKITQVECLSIIKKSVLLLKNQQTFRRHIDEWRPLLKKVGFLDPESLLKLPIGSDSIDYHHKEIFVGALIFLSSMMKVQSKWDLQGISENKQKEMRTLIRILSCGALDKQSLLKCISSSVCEGDNTLFHFNKIDTYFESYEQSSDVRLLSDAFDIDHLLHQKHTRDKSADTHVCWMGDCLEEDVDPSRLCIEGHSLDHQLKKVLLQLWTDGHPIKWEWLFDDIHCEKDHPVLYPFDRKYFWGEFKMNSVAEAVDNPGHDMKRSMESEIEYLSPVWQRIDAPLNQEIGSDKLALIIKDKEGLSDRLQHVLKEKGTPVIAIPSTLNEQEIQQVLATLKKKQPIAHTSLVIYFLASYATKPQDIDIIREGVYVPLFLLSKVIIQTQELGHVSMMAVTCNSQRIDDKDKVNGYAYGAVDGLLHVVAEESSNVTPLYLDLSEMDIELSVAAILQTGKGWIIYTLCYMAGYFKSQGP